jgi:Zn-finger nucleic acid-binding protein
MPMRRCPACAHDLYPGVIGGTLRLQCEDCCGMWFQAGRLTQAAGGSLPNFGITTPSERTCPDCETPLATVKIGAVAAEWCGSCEGIYLDAGELAELRSIADTSGQDDLVWWIVLLGAPWF